MKQTTTTDTMQKKQNLGKAKDVAIICAGLCCSGLKSCSECKECQDQPAEWGDKLQELIEKIEGMKRESEKHYMGGLIDSERILSLLKGDK